MILSKFILRARRIKAHSMVSSGEVNELAEQKMHIVMNLDSRARIVYPLPENEEVFESLVARLRPLLLEKESIYLPKVFLAIRKSLSVHSLSPEDEEMLTSFEMWFNHFVKAKDMPTYSIQLLDLEGNPLTNLMDNLLIADTWLYADLVHSDPHGGKAAACALPYESRYLAATSFYSSFAVKVVEILAFIERNESLLTLPVDKNVWIEQVVSGKTCVSEEVEGRIFYAPTGTPIPQGKINGGASCFKELTISRAIGETTPSQCLIAELLNKENQLIARYPGVYLIGENEIRLIIDDKITICIPSESVKSDNAGVTEGIPLSYGPIEGLESEANALASAFAAASTVIIRFHHSETLKTLFIPPSLFFDSKDEHAG